MLLRFAKNVFVYMSTHSYSNLSRLFLRLFAGVMILQIGMNQMVRFDEFGAYYSTMGMNGDTMVEVLIAAEMICSVLIVLGLFTRVAILPRLVIMGLATNMLMQGDGNGASAMFGMMPVMLPILFCGVLVYFGISGPGKISLDYILARYTVCYDASSIEDEKTLDEA